MAKITKPKPASTPKAPKVVAESPAEKINSLYKTLTGIDKYASEDGEKELLPSLICIRTDGLYKEFWQEIRGIKGSEQLQEVILAHRAANNVVSKIESGKGQGKQIPQQFAKKTARNIAQPFTVPTVTPPKHFLSSISVIADKGYTAITHKQALSAYLDDQQVYLCNATEYINVSAMTKNSLTYDVDTTRFGRINTNTIVFGKGCKLDKDTIVIDLAGDHAGEIITTTFAIKA